jgi:cell division transport system permease protein
VAAVIRHAVAEGWLVVRSRPVVSLVLAVVVAVPVSLAGVTVSVRQWLAPVVELGDRESVVVVLLHPRLDDGERAAWLEAQARAHPEWRLRAVAPDELARRLGEWFPYLAGVLDREGPDMLPAMVEVATVDPEGVARLAGEQAVLAVGPTSSVNRVVGRAARRLSVVLLAMAAAVVTGAVLLAAVWVHLELHRHAEEIAIMRLMGATEATVRGPFLVAVAVPSLIAAVLSVLATAGAVAWLARLAAPFGLAAGAPPAALLAAQAVGALGLPLAAAVLTLERHAADREE